MALLFCDSFDHYPTADILNKWTANAPNSPSIGAFGRNGTNGMRCGAQTNGQGIRRSVTSTATLIMGSAWRPSAIAASMCVFQFMDGTSEQLSITITSTGFLQVRRGDVNGTVLDTGTIPISEDVFYYIEMKATIANAGGTVIVRVNGVEDLNATGDTQATGNASVNGIRLFNNSQDDATDYDDLYVCNTSGGVNDDFLGDVRVNCIFPNGNGNSSQFVGSDADSTDNYLLVDDTSADDDTTYVQSATITAKDTYTFSNLTPTSGDVFGIQVLPFARKTDAGSRSICSVARLSSTEVDSADKALSTTYNYYPDIRETKPGGGSWTISDVNSAEFGQKVTV